LTLQANDESFFGFKIDSGSKKRFSQRRQPILKEATQ